MHSNRNWAQKLSDAITVSAATREVATVVRTPAVALEAVSQLREAAARYDARRDNFAQGKGATCRDIAAKVERFGSFASDKQQDFAMKLIGWSLPRNTEPRTDAGNVMRAVTMEVPKLFAVLQKHAHFYAGDLKLSRKNGESLVWVMFNGVCVGKIENAAVTYFPRRLAEAGVLAGRVNELLAEFEQDPLAAAKKFGKLSGRCCSCGADLTDPVSIDAGIGPICAKKFA